MLFQPVHDLVTSCSSCLRFDRNMVDPVTGDLLLSTNRDAIVCVTLWDTHCFKVRCVVSSHILFWMLPVVPCCNFSVPSSSSANFNLWALTWAGHFSLRSLPLTGSVIVGTILCQPSKLLRRAEKPCRQHRKTQMPFFKSLQSTFFPVLMLSLSSNQSSSPHLLAQMHQVATMWLVRIGLTVYDLKCYIHGLLNCHEKKICLP